SEDALELVVLAVDAKSRLGDTTDAGDHPASLLGVLHVDVQELARTRRVVGHGEPDDVALLLEQAGEGLLQLGGRHPDVVVHRDVRVADAGQHVGDGVGHGHVVLPPLTSWPWSRPGSLPRVRALAGTRGRGRTCGTPSAAGHTGGTGCRPAP